MKRQHSHIVRTFTPRIVKYEGRTYEILPAGDIKHATVYDRGPKGTLRRVRSPMLCQEIIDLAFPKKEKEDVHDQSAPPEETQADGYGKAGITCR